MAGKLSVLREAAEQGCSMGTVSWARRQPPREGTRSLFGTTLQYLTTGKQNQMSVTGSINIHGHSKRRTRAVVHFQSLGLGSNESWLLPVEWAAH